MESLPCPPALWPCGGAVSRSSWTTRGYPRRPRRGKACASSSRVLLCLACIRMYPWAGYARQQRLVTNTCWPPMSEVRPGSLPSRGHRLGGSKGVWSLPSPLSMMFGQLRPFHAVPRRQLVPAVPVSRGQGMTLAALDLRLMGWSIEARAQTPTSSYSSVV